jgi:hypothetical protein
MKESKERPPQDGIKNSYPLRAATGPGKGAPAPPETDKSFLVLFFKKEQLALRPRVLPPRREHARSS